MTAPCDVHTGAVNNKGYGRTNTHRYGKRIWYTHVLAWIDYNGRLPALGMKILHTCDNPPCREVSHLYEGTQFRNMQDMHDRDRHPGRVRVDELVKRSTVRSHKGQTHCVNDHEYTVENTYWSPDGRRGCKTCRAEHRDQYRAHQKTSHHVVGGTTNTQQKAN